MNWKRILLPTDYSHLSDDALGVAATLARESQGTLVLLHVEEAPVVYGAGEMYYGVADPDAATLRQMLDRIVVPPNVNVERHLVTGEPASAIVRFAEENSIDLIVMSTHGRTGLLRLLMGSVAEAVVRKSVRPVLTLKPPSDRRPPSGDRRAG